MSTNLVNHKKQIIPRFLPYYVRIKDMKKTTLIVVSIVVIIIIIVTVIFARRGSSPAPVTESPSPSSSDSPSSSVSPSSSPASAVIPASEVIGMSAGGHNITAYHFGTGTKEILFVGGIHGGYEWNTVLVASKLKDYLNGNVSDIPANVRVTVIPVLNPDGLNKVVGTDTGDFSASDVPDSQTKVISGRYNANNVDLNRNFDCDWQSTGKWQTTTVSGGSSVFSEPESLAIKNYVQKHNPSAVVVWYSAAGGVYASNCHAGVLPTTDSMVQAFANASGYPAHESFDFYATTGDMTNWLAKNGIPAMSVLLTNHSDIEWTKNLSGVKALFKLYSNLSQ